MGHGIFHLAIFCQKFRPVRRANRICTCPMYGQDNGISSAFAIENSHSPSIFEPPHSWCCCRAQDPFESGFEADVDWGVENDVQQNRTNAFSSPFSDRGERHTWDMEPHHRPDWYVLIHGIDQATV